MGRLILPVTRYVKDLARSVSQGWNAFWYTPADPTLMGVIRVFTGLMLLYTHAVWGLALDDFFGPHAWQSPELVRSIQTYQYAYSFWWLVPTDWMWTAYAVSMVILALFTIGLATRLTSVLAVIVAISFVYRTPDALFGLDQINIMLALYLTLGDCGQAVSVDRWLARNRGRGDAPPSARANLGQRLIQVHMCVIYFFAGISKLQGGSWWTGEAMWRAFANLEYQTTDMTWMAWFPWVVNVLTHVTILWEIFYCVLIWNRLWRPLMLAGAVIMHAGIGLCLGMWTFALIMMVGNAAFLPNQGVKELVGALLSRRPRPAPEPEPLPMMNPEPAPAGFGTQSRLARPTPSNGQHKVPQTVLRVDYGVH